MRRIKIPQADLEVSALCYGAGGFGTAGQGELTDSLLAQFFEAGGNFLDTAHCYGFWAKEGQGASERALGDSLRRLKARDRAVVATKGAHPDCGVDYRRPADFLSAELLASDIDDSLERMGIETIDLYYLHRDDGVTLVEEVIERLNREVRRGRIRFFGASNWSVARIEAANAYAAQSGLQGFVASQVQWSLAEPNWRATDDPSTRYVSEEEFAWHSESQLPVVAYSATANGYFAGEGDSPGAFVSDVNRERLGRAQARAFNINCTPTQVALAYLLHQPFPTIPLFSTLKPAHLDEALGSVEIALSGDDITWLRDGERKEE